VDEGEPERIGPVDCPRCGYQEKREAHFCSRCGQAMRAEAAKQARDIDESVKTDYAETPPESDDQALLGEFEALLEDHPALKEALIERQRKA